MITRAAPRVLGRLRAVWLGVACVVSLLACEKDERMRPPPAVCMDPGCGMVPPVAPGGSGGDRDAGGGPTDAAAMPSDGAVDSGGTAADQLRGTVVLVSNVVTRAGTALEGATLSIDGTRSATSTTGGAFVLEDVVARPPLYLTVSAAGARLETATLATSRTEARALAIEESVLIDEAAAVGATHGGSSGAIFIRVVDPTGVPRDGIVVSSAPPGIGPFYDLGGRFERAATVTDVAGAIAFYEVPPGRPSICVRDGTATTEACGEIPVGTDSVTFTTLVLP